MSEQVVTDERTDSPSLPQRITNTRARMIVNGQSLKHKSLSEFKKLPEFAEYAGSMAYCAGFPWFMAWSWASVMIGNTEFRDMHALALHYIAGWECERFHAEGGRPPGVIINLHRDGSRQGLGNFPDYKPVE